MPATKSVLLVSHDPATVNAVSSALHENGRFAGERVVPDLTQLAARLQHEPTPAVLVDIDAQPQHTLRELDPIIARFGTTRFIVISTEQRPDLMLAAMQSGARHFVAKSALVAELGSILHKLVPNGVPRGGRPPGALVTVLSAGGGCGATTLAVNLANELHLLCTEPVLLVDMDQHYGASASMLGLQGQYSLRDVLADPERIDAQLVRSTAVEYSKGLNVLLSPATTSFAHAGTLDHGALGAAVDACTRAYEYTVIDAPRVPLEVAGALARASKVILLVLQLAVKDIQVARETLAALNSLGASAAFVTCVINRYRRRYAMIRVEEAEAALRGARVTVVQNQFWDALRSANFGKPLAEAAPRSKLRGDLQRLAATVHQTCGERVPVAATR
jgi:pilus assembly protein CpaE